MNKKLPFLLLFCVFVFVAPPLRAQYVAIPDSNFAYWLNVNIPSAMNGNFMDTTNVLVTNGTSVILRNKQIRSLEGIQYFKGLQVLNCDSNLLTTLPSLPSTLLNLFCNKNLITNLPPLPNSLEIFQCVFNQLVVLPTLPNSLINLCCTYNYLDSLPILPNSLSILFCANNRLTHLPYLPNTLYSISCGNNFLTNLPTLPNSLKDLTCPNNQLTNLGSLPNNLIKIDCSNNQLTALPPLPNSLNVLSCNTNQITNLGALPNSIKFIDCGGNQLTSLPPLPNSLNYLYLYNNQVSTLPILPDSLLYLDFGFNQISLIPTLPTSLFYLSCNRNQLLNLPSLPSSLSLLYCYSNNLTSLPNLPIHLRELNCSINAITILPSLPKSLLSLNCSYNLINSIQSFPDSLTRLICNNNNIYCFPPFPKTIITPNYISILNNPLGCLPNYLPAMDAATLAYPLCSSGNILNNPNDCPFAQGIEGYTYADMNHTCIKDSTDAGYASIPLTLYDTNHSFLAKTYSFSDGQYNFVKPYGNYTLAVDTINVPFTVACSSPGIDTALLLNYNNLLAHTDFPIVCKNGFDVGVQSITTQGRIFPNENHTLLIDAGDLSHRYNLDCADGVRGKVQITVTGPISYVGPAAGALTPVVQGNVYTYKISDFGAISNSNDFNLVFKTKLTAQAQDAVCVQITCSSNSSGENNINNNSKEFCYVVTNSYDPNSKEVFPKGNIAPGSTDWLTYTVHFQNTGNAAAQNIHVVDSLDVNLNTSTFELVNFSHANSMSLEGGVLNFYFKNVLLPDSGSNNEASQGFLQYRIRPKNNLAMGVVIKNRAWIYFDFNPPLATNLTLNNIAQPNGINLNESVCDSFVLNGFNYLYTGNFTQILHNSFGLDSTISLHLTLNRSEKTITQTVCESFTLNSQTYDSSGVYEQTLTNTFGCDSTLTLELTVNKNSTSSLTKTACDSYTFDGNTYTSSGIYYLILPNSRGCDSLITLQLTINPSSTLSTQHSACDAYFVNGTNYTFSGVYSIPFVNSFGCPSMWNLNLTILKVDTSVTQNGLFLSSNQAGASYQWLNCNNGNSPIIGQNNQVYTATSNGNYAVVVSTNFCSDTSDCYSVLNLARGEFISNQEVALYPNPTNQELSLHSQQRLNDCSIRLLNISGEMLFEEKHLSGNDFLLDVRTIAQGLYFIELNYKDEVHRFKFVRD